MAIKEIRSPRMERGREDTTATRVLRVDSWTEAATFSLTLDASANLTGSILTQIGWATFPGFPHLVMHHYAMEAEEEDNPGPANGFGVATPRGVIVTIQYRTTPFDQQDDQNNDPDLPQVFCTHDIQASTQVLRTSLSALQWEKGYGTDKKNKQLKEGVFGGTPITNIDHTITWENLPKLNWSRLDDTFNRVNSKTFLGHPKETVWFGGFSASRGNSAEGEPRWRATYQFKHRKIPAVGGVVPGWNHFLRDVVEGDDSPWQRVVIKNSGDPPKTIFELADLKTVFSF